MKSKGKDLCSLGLHHSLHSREYINKGITINIDSLISHSSRALLSRAASFLLL